MLQAEGSDPGGLVTGRVDIEKGCMAVYRSIFRPGRVALEGL